MGIIIDIVIVLLILASTFLGYKKGLVSLAIRLIAFVIAIAITFVLYRPVADVVINSTTIDEKLQQTISANAEGFLEDGGKSKNTTENKVIESAKNGMLPETSRTLAINIIYGLTAIILFAIARIFLILLNLLADTITKLPVLKQFNELGGAICGLLRGLIITYAVLMVVNLAILANPKSQLNEIMETSYLTKTMTTYNVLNLFLNK